MGYEKHAEETIGGRAFSVVALNTESRGIEEKRRNGDQESVATYLAMTAITLVDVRLSTRHILPSARVKKPIFHRMSLYTPVHTP